jgi:hypothetical protein
MDILINKTLDIAKHNKFAFSPLRRILLRAIGLVSVNAKNCRAEYGFVVNMQPAIQGMNDFPIHPDSRLHHASRHIIGHGRLLIGQLWLAIRATGTSGERG